MSDTTSSAERDHGQLLLVVCEVYEKFALNALHVDPAYREGALDALDLVEQRILGAVPTRVADRGTKDARVAVLERDEAVQEAPCDHEWQPMTEPHKECIKCGDVRLDAPPAGQGQSITERDRLFTLIRGFGYTTSDQTSELVDALSAAAKPVGVDEGLIDKTREALSTAYIEIEALKADNALVAAYLREETFARRMTQETVGMTYNQQYEDWFHDALAKGLVSVSSDKDMQRAWDAAKATLGNPPAVSKGAK